MIDLLALAVLGVRGWQGWKKGTLLMLLSLAGLFAGYVAAAFLFRPVGNYLAETFSISPLVAFPLAGMLVMGVMTGAIRLARHTVEQRRGAIVQQGLSPSRLDSAGGALIGAAWAAGLVLIVAWLAMGIHAALKVGPDISRSVTGRITSKVTEKVAYSITRRTTGNQFVASMMALVAGQPGTGVETMNALINNKSVQQLWGDSLVRGALARGDMQALRRNATFRGLVADTQFVHAAAQLGLGGSGMGEVPGADQLMVNLVTQVGPVMQSLQSLGRDPEMRRLMNSRDFQRAMNSGDLQTIINNPEFHRVAAKFLDVLKTASEGGLRTASSN